MAVRKKTPVKASAPAVSGKPDGGARVFLIYGRDDFQVSANARRVLGGLCPAQDQILGVEEVNGRTETAEGAVGALRACLVGVRTSGFLGGRKVVWFRDCAFLKNARVLQNEDVRRWLDELTGLIQSGLPDGHFLVITAPEVDGRTAFVKACKTAGEVFVFDLPDKPWLANAFALEQLAAALGEAGLSMDEAARNEFVARAGADTAQIRQEVEKLSLYLGGRTKATVEDVRDIISPTRESLAWDLADRVLERNLTAAIQMLGRLRFQGEDPIPLLAAMEGTYRQLALLREAADRGWVRVAGSTASWSGGPDVDALLERLGDKDPRKLHPFRAAKMLEQTSRMSAEELARAESEIVRVREQVVSGFQSPDLLLEFLVLKLAAPRPAAAGGRAR